ncbi:MAG: LodA/GoxA family CTQ-dependent oxidase [Bacteroidia bacterium]|nr:LodA/GoxA family CTQ-dependent oxidase [Bacteroidia bacterium]
MKLTYKIHPAIGIARVGDSPDEFYLSPESSEGLPIACDKQGNATLDNEGKEVTTSTFKDNDGRVKRQAARFRIYVYDDKNPQGRELKIGDQVEGITSKGTLVDIEWTVYLANKKSSWFEFKELEGEHGYAPDHPRRNADIQGQARQKLIIDPGPQTVKCSEEPRTAQFARGENSGYAQSFPPKLEPYSIETLGELKTDDNNRLIVLGGYGNSGSFKNDFGQPMISNFANNDGWFDDIADGPVMAILKFWDEVDAEMRVIQVHDPAWVIVGNPNYAPQLSNLVTLDDCLYDLYVREFAYDTYLYGTGKFESREEVDISDPKALDLWRATEKQWNSNYYPMFFKEIWPILVRPYKMQWVTDFLAISNDAHEIGPRGDFDKRKVMLPPKWVLLEDPAKITELLGQEESKLRFKKVKDDKGNESIYILEDPYREIRQFVYYALRHGGEENDFLNWTADPKYLIYGKRLMPLLCGDNPLSNTLPSKFFRLTDTQLFLLKQWADGKFINEMEEFGQKDLPEDAKTTRVDKGLEIDRGVLANVLGGSFCPGGEVGWIVRNRAIYEKPYRIKQNTDFVPNSGSGRLSGKNAFMPPALSLDDNIEKGLEPGDVTKRNALPWQADFNECATQMIDVTYREWNKVYDSGNDPGTIDRKVVETLWWPSHRPMQVYRKDGDSFKQEDWAKGIPQTYEGDFKMVSEWKRLGFLLKNGAGGLEFTEVERNED